MLDSALYWLSGFYLYMWVSAFSGMLMLDAPRYVLSKVVLVVFDVFRAPFRRRAAVLPPHHPSVCAIISCLNEGKTIFHTLTSGPTRVCRSSSSTTVRRTTPTNWRPPSRWRIPTWW